MSNGPVRKAFDRSVNAARKQQKVSALDSGAIYAAQSVADRIDEDRPGDNVSAALFLKYLQALGLTPVERAKVRRPLPATTLAPETKTGSVLQKLQCDVEDRGHWD